MYLDIDHYTNLNLKYNPFSFFNQEDVVGIVEERLDLKNLADQIESSDSCCVQFYGRRGRGKSSQLKRLHTQYFFDATYVELKKSRIQKVEVTSDVLFVDSFQLLPLENKLRLLRKQKKLIMTSHLPHNIGNFANREVNKRINFSKLEVTLELLEKIVESRMKFARLDGKKSVPQVKTKYLEKLLKDHKNDLRSMQLSLYDLFLNLNKDFYEL